MNVVKTGLAAEGFAAASFVLLHVLRRDLDPVRDPLSFYALGAWGWLFAAGCVAMALAVALLALAASQAGRSRLVSASLLVCAMALAVIALVPTDPWMPWDRGPTPTGAVHNAAFVVLVAAFVLASWGLARARSFGVVFAASIIAIVIVLAFGGRPGFVGLLERVQFAIAAWWVARALSVRRASPAEPRAP